jgi:hypothetical protein
MNRFLFQNFSETPPRFGTKDDFLRAVREKPCRKNIFFGKLFLTAEVNLEYFSYTRNLFWKPVFNHKGVSEIANKLGDLNTIY